MTLGNAIDQQLGDAGLNAIRVLDRDRQPASRPPNGEVHPAPALREARVNSHATCFGP
jgi:hypothetical protein